MPDELRNSKAIAYLQQTALSRATIRNLQRPLIHAAERFKSYPGAETIALPRASWQLDEARIIPLLQQRRSLRRFAPEPVELSELAFMLWAAQGITAQAGELLFRTAPSAGALYPIETYLAVHRVTDVAPGLYHFNVRSFQLELLDKDLSATLVAAAFLDQSFMQAAAVNFIWTAVSRRSLCKYGDRGGRYLLLDAAHICQNAALAAEAVGCGCCPVAAFYDDEVCALLEVNGSEEIPLYAAAIGRKFSSSPPAE